MGFFVSMDVDCIIAQKGALFQKVKAFLSLAQNPEHEEGT